MGLDIKPIFKKTILSSGVRVVTELRPYAKAASVGFFIDAGTRDEPNTMYGAAHFVEHMVFKGTTTRDAYEIARSMEAVGGALNAYTSREETCYHATCLSEHLPLAIDVLTDLVCNAEFTTTDFRREKEVIKQELSTSSEDAEDYIYDLYYSEAFRGHEMANPILGHTKSLDQMTRKKLIDFYHGLYHGKHLVVAASGRVNHEEICAQLERTLTMRRKKAMLRERTRPKHRAFVKVDSRDGDQVHCVIGLPCAGLRDRDRFEAYVVNAALGGGMTSRLYQRIREKMGLSYSVYSTYHGFTDHGLLTVYFATAKKNLQPAISAVLGELNSLYRKGLTAAEINYYRTQVVGELTLDSEDIDSRVQAIGSQELLFEQHRPIDDIVRDIEKVNVESIKSFTKKFFATSKIGVVVFGDVPSDKTGAWIKKQLGR